MPALTGRLVTFSLTLALRIHRRAQFWYKKFPGTKPLDHRGGWGRPPPIRYPPLTSDAVTQCFPIISQVYASGLRAVGEGVSFCPVSGLGRLIFLNVCWKWRLYTWREKLSWSVLIAETLLGKTGHGPVNCIYPSSPRNDVFVHEPFLAIFLGLYLHVSRFRCRYFTTPRLNTITSMWIRPALVDL